MVDSKDDDWYLYADDFDLNVSQVWFSYTQCDMNFLFQYTIFYQRDRLDSTDSTKLLEHGDLFDDILTAPTASVKKEPKEEEQDDEVRNSSRKWADEEGWITFCSLSSS